MNIKQAYLQVIQEDTVEEGMIKTAIGAAVIAGAALGATKMINKPVDHSMRVVAGAVHKFEKTPMTQFEAADELVKKWKIHPNTANQITHAAWKHGSNDGSFPTPHHLMGLMATESSFNPEAKSNLKVSPAIGLTQIRPKISGIHPKELATIDGQVKHSVNILKDFHRRSGGDIEMALNSYNSGFRAVYNDRPTVNKKYAPKVLSATDKFYK